MSEQSDNYKYDKLLDECERWDDEGLPVSLDELPGDPSSPWWSQHEYLNLIKLLARCAVRALIPIGILLVLWLANATLKTSQEVTGERVNRLERMMYSIEMEE